ncbi:aromatic ring-hydroxylating oxygenase subunit alpha [Nocardioides sp. GXZ039]|uniref:aromatic ring-hydroxylating oxygenase subunit alpha n=1 Tax=Nocardioides sp. GXZ039 TaxID=3136018 RepID=UPI0030F46CB4
MNVDIDGLFDFDAGMVCAEIFVDEDVYKLELERVFGRSWVFLAHDSMIPRAGDFLQTYIGEDPIVVARQKDGSVRAFLNQCIHRGMRICRADEGNARSFMCSFHGWTYDTAGNLTGVPHEKTVYRPNTFDKSTRGPRKVTRVESYKGFHFGTWAEDAPSLLEYLGDMAWYFDAYIDRYSGGLEAIANHRWIIPANWKLKAEQFASDALHAEISHASAIQVMTPKGTETAETNHAVRAVNATGHQFASPYGHGTGWFDVPGSLHPDPVVANWENEQRENVASRLGALRADTARGHATIFPNFHFLLNGTFRVVHPRGPNEMEIWAWTMVPAEAPEPVKENYARSLTRTFSPSGMFEQDDAENWAEIQRILRGKVARGVRLSYEMVHDPLPSGASEFPGYVVPANYSDVAALGLYRHYADLMSSHTWAEAVEMKLQREAAK